MEPPSPAQDGGPGLKNALPPPETAETVNSLWVWRWWHYITRGRFCQKQLRKACLWHCACVWQAGGGRDSGEPLMGDGSRSGDVAEGRQLESWGTPWGQPGKHDQLSGSEVTRRHTHTPRTTTLHSTKHTWNRRHGKFVWTNARSIQHLFSTSMSSLPSELPKNRWGYLNDKLNYDLANPSPWKAVRNPPKVCAPFIKTEGEMENTATYCWSGHWLASCFMINTAFQSVSSIFSLTYATLKTANVLHRYCIWSAAVLAQMYCPVLTA